MVWVHCLDLTRILYNDLGKWLNHFTWPMMSTEKYKKGNGHQGLLSSNYGKQSKIVAEQKQITWLQLIFPTLHVQLAKVFFCECAGNSFIRNTLIAISFPFSGVHFIFVYRWYRYCIHCFRWVQNRPQTTIVLVHRHSYHSYTISQVYWNDFSTVN